MPYQFPSNHGPFVNEVLQEAAIAFGQEQSEFIGYKIFPHVPVKGLTGLFPKWDKDDIFRLQMQEWDGRSVYHTGGQAVSSDTFSLKLYDLGVVVTPKDKVDWMGQIDINKARAHFLVQQYLLKAEKEILDVVFTASNWTGQWDGVSGTPSTNEVKQWSASGSTPISDMRTLHRVFKLQSGIKANTLIVGDRVHNKLVEHDDMIAKLGDNQLQMVSEDIIKNVFGLKNYFVSSAIYNTAAADATGSYARIEDTDALLAYIPESASMENPSAGYLLLNTEYQKAAQNGVPQIQTIDLLEPIGAQKHVATAGFQAKVTSADLGLHVATLVAAGS